MQNPNLIELLSQHELKISELYDFYADLFANDKFFWHDLANAEREHAGWLHDLKDHDSDFKNFKTDDIIISLDSIDYLIKEAQSDLSQEDAFFNAYQYETNIIESRFLEVFLSTSDTNFDRVILRLIEETKEHSNMLKKKLDEIL